MRWRCSQLIEAVLHSPGSPTVRDDVARRRHHGSPAPPADASAALALLMALALGLARLQMAYRGKGSAAAPGQRVGR